MYMQDFTPVTNGINSSSRYINKQKDFMPLVNSPQSYSIYTVADSGVKSYRLSCKLLTKSSLIYIPRRVGEMFYIDEISKRLSNLNWFIKLESS